jgi:hypothetical protein
MIKQHLPTGAPVEAVLAQAIALAANVLRIILAPQHASVATVAAVVMTPGSRLPEDVD